MFLFDRTNIYTQSPYGNGHQFTDLFYPVHAETDSVREEEAHLDLNQTLSGTIAFSPNNTVCYEDLGCITRFSFADPLLWPINLLPESREKINTHYTLYTREQPYNTTVLRIFFFFVFLLFRHDVEQEITLIILCMQNFIQISAKDPNGIMATSFKATRRTKFYIHGWHATGYEDRYQVS